MRTMDEEGQVRNTMKASFDGNYKAREGVQSNIYINDRYD